jgi:glycosyltransferase involved in cell wall biosynthesis
VFLTIFSYFYCMPVRPQNIRVAFSVTNCICNDQRVLKIAGVVCKLGCDIEIIGRKSGDCCDEDSVPFKTKRFRMLFKKGFLFYAFFNVRLFIFLLQNKYDLLVSDDLDTLLPNFLVSKLKRLPLVYDSHEYFTGVPEIQKRPFVRWVWKKIEKSVFPRLTHIMTVSDSIALQYENEYHIRPLTIRNCAIETSDIIPFSRQELELKSEDLLLILQGTGINIDRGGTELIEAVNLTERVSLLIIGSGDEYESLIQKTAKLRLSDRIKFFPKVSWNILMKYTRSADAGISLDKNTNLNYLFSLPNKVFDYLSAGIPVIATDLPEIARILNTYRCGILIEKPDPEEICKAIIKIRDNKVLLDELKANAVVASESINWGTESIMVEKLYRSIIENL